VRREATRGRRDASIRVKCSEMGEGRRNKLKI